MDAEGNPTEGSLLAFAAHEIALGMRQADGATLRDHYQSMERQSGKTPEGLVPLECPEETLYLWEYFSSMNERRVGGDPITDAGVEAWARRHNIQLRPFEQRALDVLEKLYLSAMHEAKVQEYKLQEAKSRK